MRHLNLVESDFEHLEKRILPRFPFCYLTFKGPSQLEADAPEKVFEVKDISYSGMQLALKSNAHGLKEEQTLKGILHWQGRELHVQGQVKWSTEKRLGVEFYHTETSKEQVESFLELEKLAAHLRPVHMLDYGVDLPPTLKFWLRADGPVEVFAWSHNDGELARFQILIMENFVEWEDGKGLKTARVISKRDIETPLIDEDEFVFKVDENIDDFKVMRARELVRFMPKDHITPEAIEFIEMKLR